MKKTEVLTIIGFVVGIGMMFFGMGSSLHLFFDVPSLAITLGGCIGVISIITPGHVLKKFGVLVGQALKESTESKNWELIGTDIEKLQTLIDQLEVVEKQNTETSKSGFLDSRE